MGIHLLYIPLLPRSAIFNKSNFYFYWLQYTQYLRTDLITKGLLGNLLPPNFSWKWNTRQTILHFILLEFPDKTSPPTQFRILDLWNLHLTTHNYALRLRSRRTWKEMDVWIELKSSIGPERGTAQTRPGCKLWTVSREFYSNNI